MTVKQTEATAQTSQKEQGPHSREESQTGQQARASRQGQAQPGAQAAGAQSQDTRLTRRDRSLAFMSPFTLLQRFFKDDLAGLLTDVRSQHGRMSQPEAAGANVIPWAPKVDMVQRGNELVVRADLPGVSADDVTVEIGDDAITISGERQEEHAEENNGVYRYERSYGAFFREIPLPEGAMVDQAKATFKDGVLEITVPAPPEQVSRGRRLEISRGDQANNGDANKGR